MEMLKSKLYEIELKKEDEENKKNRSEKSNISWGNQIHSHFSISYVTSQAKNHSY